MTANHYQHCWQRLRESCSAALGVVVTLPACCSFLAGLAVLLWEIFYFLANNHWTTITVLGGLRWWIEDQWQASVTWGPSVGFYEHP